MGKSNSNLNKKLLDLYKNFSGLNTPTQEMKYELFWVASDEIQNEVNKFVYKALYDFALKYTDFSDIDLHKLKCITNHIELSDFTGEKEFKEYKKSFEYDTNDATYEQDIEVEIYNVENFIVMLLTSNLDEVNRQVFPTDDDDYNAAQELGSYTNVICMKKDQAMNEIKLMNLLPKTQRKK